MSLRYYGLGIALFSSMATHANSLDHDILLNDIGVRAGVKTDISLRVFVNEARPCNNKNVLAVHGLGHTGSTWENFAEALFANNSSSTDVCNVYAINFIARGGSGLPTLPLTLGDLGLQDNARILRHVLQRLKKSGIRFNSIVGHSAGTNTIELLQNHLVSKGKNLKERFGIKQAIFLAPSGSGNFVPPDSGSGAGLIAPFIVNDPVLGDVVALPDFLFPFFFFANLVGEVDPNAPSDAEVTAKAYNAPESLRLTRQILNIAPEVLPSIPANLFNDTGSKLTVIGGSNDPFVPAALAEAEYQLNTGDVGNNRLRIIEDDFAVHSLYMTNPELILSVLPAGTSF